MKRYHRHIIIRAQSTVSLTARASARIPGIGFCNASPVSIFQNFSVPKNTAQKITIAIGIISPSLGVPNHIAGPINPLPGRNTIAAPTAPPTSKLGSRKFIQPPL